MASSPPKFFRILLQRNLEDPKLMIPKKFVEDYGKVLSSSVNLNLPDGKEWKVGLTTTDYGAVWLQKGWDKFLEHYCLEIGSLLVFKLIDGTRNVRFKVAIFDPTGVETKYSCYFKSCKPQLQQDHSVSDDSYESLENLHRNSKKRKKVSVPCRHSRRNMRKDDEFTIKTEPEEEEEECNNTMRDIPSCKKRRMPKNEEVKVSRKKQSLGNKVEATQRFTSKSDHKPSFKVVMRRSSVRGRFNLIIPIGFASKHLSDDFGTIKLQTTNGRNWTLIYKWCRSNKTTFVYISSGWKQFAEENHLKEGDIGFFQLINNKRHILFTKLQDTSSFPSLSPNKETSTTERKKNPFFEVDIFFKSYKNSFLNIPMTFAKKYFSPQMHSATLEIGKKRWNVTLKQYEGYVRFSSGWNIFRGECGLEDGDKCLFEMVNIKHCVFKVSIFKKLSSSASMD